MGFLAPALPLIGKVLPGIGGMLGGLFGGGKPKLSPFEQQMQKNQLDLSNLGMDSMRGAGDYWSRILKGGPDAMMAMSPEIRNAHGMFSGIRNQAGTFAPMGGGRANIMAQLPYKEAGAISDIFSRARPAAASGLAGLGGSALSGAGSLESILSGELERTKQGAATGGMLGGGIFNILTSLLKPKAPKDTGIFGGGRPGDYATPAPPAMPSFWG